MLHLRTGKEVKTMPTITVTLGSDGSVTIKIEPP